MLKKEEIISEIEEKIWLLKTQAEELQEILKIHGEKVIPLEQLILINVATTDTAIKFSKISERFDKKLNIFNQKQG